MSLIEIRNLNKYYRIGKNSFHVLKDINLHVERGDFVSIEGKSGAGKSTLLNLLGCIDTFDSGEYCLDGKQIERLSEAKLAAVRNTKIGYVFQDFVLSIISRFFQHDAPAIFQQNLVRRNEAPWPAGA